MTDVPEPRLPIARFDYDLPEELIAQHPIEPRDASRLLVVDRATGSLSDHIFRDLPDLLTPGDLLVLNDTRVIPARLFTRRATGGQVELLFLEKLEHDTWRVLARPARRLRAGEPLTVLDPKGEPVGVEVTVRERDPDMGMIVSVEDADTTLHRYGQMPLPPYIRERLEDAERYQTVFAEREGSAAAPTAGLHFTPELLDRCRERGLRIEHVTLHVGLDTFQPVKVDDALEHTIHSEWYDVSATTLGALRDVRAAGRRVVAVGTTVARTLETIAPQLDQIHGVSGATSIYITPPYRFQMVDAMVTNFHLPRTTLLLMVSALAGEETIRAAYAHAIRERYRFYSFGDAMLIV